MRPATLLLILGATACTNFFSAPLPPARPADTGALFPAPTSASTVHRIQLERTACFGTCPVYTVTFDRDGTGRYHGEQYVRDLGDYVGRIDTVAFRRLAERILTSGFFQFKTEYAEQATDLPSTVLTVAVGDTSKRVLKYGDVGPAVLDSIGHEVDSLTDRITWIPASAP